MSWGEDGTDGDFIMRADGGGAKVRSHVHIKWNTDIVNHLDPREGDSGGGIGADHQRHDG